MLERRGEIDGNLYFVLDPAAKALEGRHPLAAVLRRRDYRRRRFQACPARGPACFPCVEDDATLSRP